MVLVYKNDMSGKIIYAKALVFIKKYKFLKLLIMEERIEKQYCLLMNDPYEKTKEFTT